MKVSRVAEREHRGYGTPPMAAESSFYADLLRKQPPTQYSIRPYSPTKSLFASDEHMMDVLSHRRVPSHQLPPGLPAPGYPGPFSSHVVNSKVFPPKDQAYDWFDPVPYTASYQKQQQQHRGGAVRSRSYVSTGGYGTQWSGIRGARGSESAPTVRLTERFSRKLFVGGLPADVEPGTVEAVFGAFGRVMVDWPREALHPKLDRDTPQQWKYGGRTNNLNGYVFLVYEDENSVQALVNAAHHDENGQYFIFINSPSVKNKPAQIRPWELSSGEFWYDGQTEMDPRRAVFIGGVPRPTTARDLMDVLESKFGPVHYVGIDTDPELKYPKGAARVVFHRNADYLAAIRTRFVKIPGVESNKREVEIKPYMMDEQMCDECVGGANRYASYFCGAVECLQYYCHVCWDALHYGKKESGRCQHKPLVRLGDQTKLMHDVPHHMANSPVRYLDFLEQSINKMA